MSVTDAKFEPSRVKVLMLMPQIGPDDWLRLDLGLKLELCHLTNGL